MGADCLTRIWFDTTQNAEIHRPLFAVGQRRRLSCGRNVSKWGPQTPTHTPCPHIDTYKQPPQTHTHSPPGLDGWTDTQLLKHLGGRGVRGGVSVSLSQTLTMKWHKDLLCLGLSPRWQCIQGPAGQLLLWGSGKRELSHTQTSAFKPPLRVNSWDIISCVRHQGCVQTCSSHDYRPGVKSPSLPLFPAVSLSLCHLFFSLFFTHSHWLPPYPSFLHLFHPHLPHYHTVSFSSSLFNLSFCSSTPALCSLRGW